MVNKYDLPQEDIVAIIGEYDAPAEQYQDILLLKLNEEGNTLVYGETGANKDMFISTIIYSVCNRYSADDINIYLKLENMVLML